MATPLAVLVVLLATAPSWAGPCPVPALNQENQPTPLEESHPACVAAQAQLPRFERLQAASGLSPSQLAYYVQIGAKDDEENAWQMGGKVYFNDAYLRKFPPESLAYLSSLAHEIGHAVQRADGSFAWRDSVKPKTSEHAARERRLESHADAIAVELLLRAGYSPDIFVKGREERLTCGVIVEKPSGVTTHPAPRYRWLNTLLVTPRVAPQLDAITARGLERLAESAPAESDAAFTGAGSRRLDAETSPAHPAVRNAVPFKPLVTVHDFDAKGRFLPGRLASSDLRLTPPPPGSGAVKEHFYFIASAYTDRLADMTQDVVNWWHTREGLADLTVRACGKVTGARHDQAVMYGVSDWSRAAARRTAEWLDGLLNPRSGQK